MDSAAELALVQRAQGGDAAAFTLLALHHGPRLVRFLTTMTGCETTAEDLRQVALQQAFTKLPQLAEPAKFGSWLLSIACTLMQQGWLPEPGTNRSQLYATLVWTRIHREAVQKVAGTREPDAVLDWQQLLSAEEWDTVRELATERGEVLE